MFGIAWTTWVQSSVVVELVGVVTATGSRETPYAFTSFSLAFALSLRLFGHSF